MDTVIVSKDTTNVPTERVSKDTDVPTVAVSKDTDVLKRVSKDTDVLAPTVVKDGKHLHLPEEQSRKPRLHTILAASKLVLENLIHPADALKAICGVGTTKSVISREKDSMMLEVVVR